MADLQAGLIREYRTWCPCGNRGPARETPQWAIDSARNHGWRVPLDQDAGRFLCPTCVSKKMSRVYFAKCVCDGREAPPHPDGACVPLAPSLENRVASLEAWRSERRRG